MAGLIAIGLHLSAFAASPPTTTWLKDVLLEMPAPKPIEKIDYPSGGRNMSRSEKKEYEINRARYPELYETTLQELQKRLSKEISTPSSDRVGDEAQNAAYLSLLMKRVEELQREKENSPKKKLSPRMERVRKRILERKAARERAKNPEFYDKMRSIEKKMVEEQAELEPSIEDPFSSPLFQNIREQMDKLDATGAFGGNAKGAASEPPKGTKPNKQPSPAVENQTESFDFCEFDYYRLIKREDLKSDDEAALFDFIMNRSEEGVVIVSFHSWSKEAEANTKQAYDILRKRYDHLDVLRAVFFVNKDVFQETFLRITNAQLVVDDTDRFQRLNDARQSFLDDLKSQDSIWFDADYVSGVHTRASKRTRSNHEHAQTTLDMICRPFNYSKDESRTVSRLSRSIQLHSRILSMQSIVMGEGMKLLPESSPAYSPSEIRRADALKEAFRLAKTIDHSTRVLLETSNHEDLQDILAQVIQRYNKTTGWKQPFEHTPLLFKTPEGDAFIAGYRNRKPSDGFQVLYVPLRRMKGDFEDGLRIEGLKQKYPSYRFGMESYSWYFSDVYALMGAFDDAEVLEFK